MLVLMTVEVADLHAPSADALNLRGKLILQLLHGDVLVQQTAGKIFIIKFPIAVHQGGDLARRETGRPTTGFTCTPTEICGNF